MSGKGPGSGFDFQSRAIAFVAVHILARRQLKWSSLVSGDLPVAMRAESGGGGDDIRIELVGSETIYECQAKKGLSADTRLDAAIDRFSAGLASKSDERGLLIVDPTSSRTISFDLHDALEHWRQGIHEGPVAALQRVLARLRTHSAEHLADRLYVQTLDVEQDSSQNSENALLVLERELDDEDQVVSAWAVLVADGLRLCKEGGRRTRDDLVALLGKANIQLSGQPRGSGEKLDILQNTVEELNAKLSNIVVPPSAPSEPGAERLTIQLDTARDLLNRGGAQAALDLLSSAVVLPPEVSLAVQSRHMNLLAAALLHLGKSTEALEQLNRILELQPEDRIALANMAQARMSLGQPEAALEAADRLIELEPLSRPAWVVKVQLQPSMASPLELEEVPEILTARASTEMKRHQFEAAVDLVRRAINHEPHDERLVLLAQALCGRAQLGGSPVSDRGELESAVVSLTSVLQRRPQHNWILERALTARGQIHSILGDDQAALADFEEAVRLYPESLFVVYLGGMKHLLLSAPEKTIAMINRVPNAKRDAALHSLMAQALAELGNREEAKGFLHAASSAVTAEHPDMPVRIAIVELGIDLDELETAEATMNLASIEPAWLSDLFRARLAAKRENDTLTRQEFESALLKINGQDRARVGAEFAEYLRQEGDARQAVAVFERTGAVENSIVWPHYGRALYDAKELVKAAALLQRARSELSDLPGWALQLGARVALISDDVSAEIEYLNQLRSTRPEDVEVLIRLAQAYLRDANSDSAQDVLDAVAEVTTIAPRQRLHLAELNIRAGRPELALPLAYRALREEPDAEDIQMVYVSLFLRRESEQEGLERDIVGTNSLVILRTDNGDTLSYFIVGEGAPNRAAGEIAADDPIAARLLGLRVGDRITLRQGSPSTTDAEVLEIKTHYVHAFQDTLAKFPQRHPESTVLQSFKVPDNPQREDFSFIEESVKAKAESGNLILDQYLSQCLPLGVVAGAMNASIPDVFWALATDGARSVLVEYSDGHESSAAAAGSELPAVVTRSALISAEHLGVLGILKTLHPVLLVPRSLLDELAEERVELAEKAKKGTAAFVQESSGMVHREVPAEAYQAQLVRFDDMCSWMKENCIAQARPLASIESENQALREALGPSSYDAIALTRFNSGEIYADDLGLRRLVLAEAKRFGFSTFGLITTAHTRRILSDEQFANHLAILLRLRQQNIPMTAAALCAAFVSSEYAVDWRVSPLLDRLRDKSIPTAAVIGFLVSAFLQVALSVRGPQHIGSVAYALVESALFERENAGAMLGQVLRVARARMQLLPVELDLVGAALRRYDDFVLRNRRPFSG